MKNLIQKAILMAMEAHKSQVRKGDGKTPYILHPLEVGITLSYYTASEELIAAAILHDVIEDSSIKASEIKQEFGEEVCDAVELLTENKKIEDWAERKAENLNRLSQNKTIYIIKAVDSLVNMKELFALIEDQREAVWKRFNASKEMKMAYFEKIFNEIKADLPASLLEQYVSTMKDLQYSHLIHHETQEIGF